MEGGNTSDYISNYKKHSIAVNIIAKKKKKICRLEIERIY